MCRTCEARNHALSTSIPNQLNVSLVTLTFKTPVDHPNSRPYVSLNTVLNNITDAAESTSHPSVFTTWSPCLSDPNVAVILTTASETCRDSRSAIFEPVFQYLSSPPDVSHVYLDLAVLSLAASSPEQRIAVDIIILGAPNPSVAGAIGRCFGWDPRRNALSPQMEAGDVGAAFSRPGDLIRDFWAWAELRQGNPSSPSSSVGSANESFERPSLISTNSEEKNMSMFFAEDEERHNREEETLIMIFQWSSHVDGDRFKHPLQKSYGRNGRDVSDHMWERHIAHPVRQMQGIGAKTSMFRLELRGVEPRIDNGKASTRDRSGSRRLASGFGERVSGSLSGFWSR
ncbi:hypothetical protein CC80DRAFT_544715 [Byssothecium circinans]|uniref:Uncharacterized protein n=1 Tax=Byssothecium circinans TaxID=147558 RepID=A0A6A5UBK4_9PLEO|nr:hypothetical protein CC80DRAFT_544715 [Byssothecium circinans]